MTSMSEVIFSTRTPCCLETELIESDFFVVCWGVRNSGDPTNFFSSSAPDPRRVVSYRGGVGPRNTPGSRISPHGLYDQGLVGVGLEVLAMSPCFLESEKSTDVMG
jgi:hypothetical protein